MKKFLAITIFVLTPLFLLAQSLQDQIDQFMTYYTELLTGLTIIWGYVARFIPKLKDAPMKVLNVIAFLLVAGGAFIWMDLASPLQVVIAAFASAGIYSYILKPGTKLFELASKYMPLLLQFLLGGLFGKNKTQPEVAAKEETKVAEVKEATELKEEDKKAEQPKEESKKENK